MKRWIATKVSQDTKHGELIGFAGGLGCYSSLSEYDGPISNTRKDRLYTSLDMLISKAFAVF